LPLAARAWWRALKADLDGPGAGDDGRRHEVSLRAHPGAESGGCW
jgi:hypothetical protein